MSEPIGKSVELFEDNIGLFVKAKLPKEDDLVKGRVVPQMKVGSINEITLSNLVNVHGRHTKPPKSRHSVEPFPRQRD